MSGPKFQKNDWVEKFDEFGGSMGCAYVLSLTHAGMPVVCHLAEAVEFPPDRLALRRRGSAFPNLSTQSQDKPLQQEGVL